MKGEKIKKCKEGPQFQMSDRLPIITDLVDYPEATKQDHKENQKAIEVWDPSKVTDKELGK